MPLDFPTSPAVNDIYTFGGRSWIWNGIAWDVYSTVSGTVVTTLNGLSGGVTLAAGSNITLSPVGNTITIASSGGGGGGSGNNFTESTSAPTPFFAGDRWFDTDEGNLYTAVTDDSGLIWVQLNAGIVGASGPAGNTGATGAQGPQGNTGATGATGPQGNTGATGPQGNTGPSGIVGDYVTSLRGLTGIIGLSAGSNITITQSGNTLTIASTASGGGGGGLTAEDSIGIYLDSTPDDLSTGKKGFKQIPYNCEILEWYVLAGQTGSIEFDVKSGSFANYPTTTSIVGGDYPNLTTQLKNSNIGVTAWSGLTSGDIIDFFINSNTGIESVGLFLKIRRTS